MSIELSTPTPSRIHAVVDVLRGWQSESAPMQLHPGDLGWAWSLGPDALAAATRIWSVDGELRAIGFLDGPDVLRVTPAPASWRDDAVARRIVGDVAAPGRGVLPDGEISIEVPDDTRLRDVFTEAGWGRGEAWTPLARDLADPVEPVDLQVEVVGTELVSAFTAVHRSAWGNARFTDEQWFTMASGPAFADARCLLGRNRHGVAVAGVTVWSAGPGRPGVLEPMGVHAAHRGRGHGMAICVAAAAELQRMGASSARVCTPSSLVSAVATYRAAGYREQPERLDVVRPLGG